jgi:hypothetical protein
MTKKIPSPLLRVFTSKQKGACVWMVGENTNKGEFCFEGVFRETAQKR